MDRYMPYEENHQGNFRASQNFGENHFDPSWQRPQTTTLFLGDLSVVCDEENLFDLFRHYGDIETIQLKKSDRDPQRAHLGFGFLKFTTRESAERAMQDLNGYFYLGRAMRVGWADDYDKRRGGVVGFGAQQKAYANNNNKKNRQTAQIHVMFVSRELNRRVSELDLGTVFGQFGNLVDIAIKKNAINAEYQVQSGYAFVHYHLSNEGIQSAISAVEQVNNRSFDEISYQCKVTHSLQAQILSMKYRGGGSNHHEGNNYALPGEFMEHSSHASNPVMIHQQIRGRQSSYRNTVVPPSRFEPFVPQQSPHPTHEVYDTYGARPVIGSNDRFDFPPAPPSFSSSTYDKPSVITPPSELAVYNSNDFLTTYGEVFHPPSLSMVHDVLRDEEDGDLGTTSISATTTITTTATTTAIPHSNTGNSSLNSVRNDLSLPLQSEKEFIP